MVAFSLKNHGKFITVISDETEKDSLPLKHMHFVPVYSREGYFWAMDGTYQDLMDFIGIDTRGKIDWAYPCNYEDPRMIMDKQKDYGGPLWDYRDEKSPYGAPLYKSEIFETVSGIIRFMLENGFFKAYTFDEHGLLKRMKSIDYCAE